MPENLIGSWEILSGADTDHVSLILFHMASIKAGAGVDVMKRSST